MKDSDKKDIEEQIARVINAGLVNRINRRDHIKHIIKREVKESVITKGIVAGMLAVSAGGYLGVLGGSLLTSVGWRVIVNTLGPRAGITILGGIAGMSGISLGNPYRSHNCRAWRVCAKYDIFLRRYQL